MTRILDGEEQRELDFSNQQGASSNESLDPSNTGEYTPDDVDDKGAVDDIKVDPDPVDPDPVTEKPKVENDVDSIFNSGYDPTKELDKFTEENYYDDDPMGEIGIASSTGLTPEQAATIQKSGYTGSLKLGDDPSLKLAAEQGDARAIFNSFGKAISGAFGEIIATPGYISEAVEDWRGTQDGYNNFLIEARDEIMEATQDFAPVYLNRGEIGTLDVLNGEWWASHVEQLGPTLALLGVGLATDGLLTPTIMRGFAATAKGVNDLKMAQTILSQGSKVNTRLRAGVSATTSRLMEGTMEAYQVQQAAREKYKKEGKSEEEAIALSSEDAKQAMTANMALVLMDAFQFNLAFKGLAGLSAGAKALHGTKNLAVNMATEAIEEGIQHIITEKAIGEQSFAKGRNISDIIGDEEFTKAMESGAFGGVVFAAGGPAINKATESIRYAASKEYKAKIDKLKEKEDARLEAVKVMEESYRAIVDGKVNKSEYLNDKLFDKTVIDALNNGTEDSLSQSLDDRLKLSDDELSKMGSKTIMGLDVTPREFLENKKEVVDAIIAKKKELQDFYGRDSENADISNELLNAHMSAISMSSNLKFANKHKAKLEAEASKVTSKNSATLNEAIEAKDKHDGLSDMIVKKTEQVKSYSKFADELGTDESASEIKAQIKHEEILLEELIRTRDNTKKTLDERKKLLTKEEKVLYSNHMPGKLANAVANIETLNYYNNLAQAEINVKSKPEYRNKKEIEQADMMFQQLDVESELIQARRKFSNKNKKIDRLLKNRIDDIRKEKEGNSTSQQKQKAADAITKAKETKERIRIAEEEAKKQKIKIKNRAQAINSSNDIFTKEDIDGLSNSSREDRNIRIESLNANLEDQLTNLDNLSDEDFSKNETTRAEKNSELEKAYVDQLNAINSAAIEQTIQDNNNLKDGDTPTIDYFNEKEAASLENAKRGLYIDSKIKDIHDKSIDNINTIESEIKAIALRIANNQELENDIQDKASLTSALIEAKETLTEFEKVNVFDLIKEYYLTLNNTLKEQINKREQQDKIQNEKLNNAIDISKTMSLAEDGNHYTNESGDLYERQSNYVKEKRNNTEDLKNNPNVINSLIGGNIIDNIGRDVFSNSGKTRSKKEYIAEALKKHEKEYGKKKFTMSDKHFSNIVKMMIDYKNSFPEGTKFYSNDITVFKDYAKPKVNSKGETIKGVAGVIDLLVQTPDGKFHIVDFKSKQIKKTKKSVLKKYKFKSKAELSNEVFNNPFNNDVSQLEKWGDQQTVYEYLIDLDIESINIMLIPYGYAYNDSGIEVLSTYDSADNLDINEDNSSDISDNIIQLESSSFIGDNFENDFERIYEPKDDEVKGDGVKGEPSKLDDLKLANEGDTHSIIEINKKTKKETKVKVIFSNGKWRKQKKNGEPYTAALPQAKQDLINSDRALKDTSTPQASEVKLTSEQQSKVDALQKLYPEIKVGLTKDGEAFEVGDGRVVMNQSNTDLNSSLKNFLNDFNITVKEYESIKDALGITDSTQAVSMVEKFIAVEKGEPLDASVAFLAYSFLGKQNNKIKSNLKYHIKKWSKYNESFDRNAKEFFEEKGWVEDKDKWFNEIRDKVIIEYLAETIVEYHKNPTEFERIESKKWTKEDFTYIKKLYRAILKILGLKEDKRSYSVLNNIAKNIASEVLTNDYDILDYPMPEDQILKHYQETIESDPFAQKIVEHHQNDNMVLTGSLALRKAGTVYRTEKEALHDLDFVVPWERTNTKENKKIIHDIKRYQGPDIEYSSAQGVRHAQELDWFKNFKKAYPSYKVLVGYYGGEHSNFESLTLTGVIDGEYWDSKGVHKEKQYDGTYKDVKHKKGDYKKDTGYIVDHFIRLNDSGEQHENYFKIWKEITIAKLMMGRSKDLTDHKNFVPFIKSKGSYNFYYKDYVYQKKKPQTPVKNPPLNQKDSTGNIKGQANIDAMTVLFDVDRMSDDTIYHEFAHHYIAWNRNTPIVQEAIKKWDTEEKLVQAIGEQSVAQNGEAKAWFTKFIKWLKEKINKLSDKNREELRDILTDAFLSAKQNKELGLVNTKPTQQNSEAAELLELRRNASEYTDKGYKAAEKAIKDKYALKPTQQSSEV
ncbi:MAG: hypothetical protein P8P29_07800, partial [Flavobacteriaceae bacterium]|nr:hypothetical protein [Flavobacteriaceae bacterium]